jgi:hypothetical protein
MSLRVLSTCLQAGWLYFPRHVIGDQTVNYRMTLCINHASRRERKLLQILLTTTKMFHYTTSREVAGSSPDEVDFLIYLILQGRSR